MSAKRCKRGHDLTATAYVRTTGYRECGLCEDARTRWHHMIRRCTNPRDPAYKNYGERGVTVCDRWLDFDSYYADTGDAPAGKSLDRIDNDGIYEPGNVRWATALEQTRNRRPAENARKTHCPQGHPYSGVNLIIRAGGGRQCRMCKNEYQRRWHAEKVSG